MQQLGKHHSTRYEQRLVGHSLLERNCPLRHLYRQQSTCQAEGEAFRSKIDSMEKCIRTFEPVLAPAPTSCSIAGTQYSNYQRVKWPGSAQEVYVHVVTTCVRKLYQCQVVIVRQSLDSPLPQALLGLE